MSKQFLTILAWGIMVVLTALALGSVFDPVQAYPILSITPTPGKSPTPRDLHGVTVKTERLRQTRLEASSLSSTSTGIVNGGFESGLAGWTEYSFREWPLINHKDDLPVLPHSGDWAAWLGGDNNEVAYISQTVTLPAGNISLTFWEKIDSEDYCGFDFAWVSINNIDISTINLCQDDNTVGWVKRTIGLSAYAGQTVSLQIRVKTDESLISNYFVDDVALSGAAGENYAYLPLNFKEFLARVL